MARVNKQVLVILGGLMGSESLLNLRKNIIFIWISNELVVANLVNLGQSMEATDLTGKILIKKKQM